MRWLGSLILVYLFGLTPELTAGPNILILYVDDLGYADLGVTGNTDCPTPNMDSLAINGARFINSYVTGCVCSPSRAALLTGRYQQRFGFDANAEGGGKLVKGTVKGLDLEQRTLADYLKQLGYTTGVVGKWHLGSDAPEYLPNARGFDEFYGLYPSGISAGKMGQGASVFRNGQPVATPTDYMHAFAKEAESFIDRHHDKPWLLYVPFTAVHGPHVAPPEYQARFQAVKPVGRGKYLAQLSQLDDLIGGLLQKLRIYQLEENTLIFFASDNGGAGNAKNDPFRGGKWSLWEGGIRSPILIQWKGTIAPGQELPKPVTQLDWLPTALAAAGLQELPANLDGVNLLPVLTKKTETLPQRALYWRFGVQYAIRAGDWKLIKPALQTEPQLFNLRQDPGEKNNLGDSNLAQKQRLQQMWDEWNAQNEPPRWLDNRWNDPDAPRGKGKGKTTQAKPKT